jgi:riboflavin synthase
MFTGLVTAIGTIDRVRETEAGREFRVRCDFTGVVAGESIALNGACLTVREFGDGWFTVAAIVTTLDRTTIGDWREGRRVNLERALALGDRLGGHIVQGHVDHLGTVQAVARRADALVLDLDIPASLEPLLVPQGSITVDGVSLTVNALPAPRVLQLSLIEYTWQHTTLGGLAVGDRVHLEADVIAKHVQRLVAPYGAAGRIST